MKPLILVVNNTPSISFELKNFLTISTTGDVYSSTSVIHARKHHEDKTFNVVLLGNEASSIADYQSVRRLWPKAYVIIMSEQSEESYPNDPQLSVLSMPIIQPNQRLHLKSWFVKHLHPQLMTTLSKTRGKSVKLPFQRTPHLIVVASSCGGPSVLRKFLTTLPDALSSPIIIAQHVPDMFDVSLCQSLNSVSKRYVQLARDRQPIMQNEVYLAPFDYHTEVLKEDFYMISLNQKPPEHFLRPAADPLFRSAAALYKKQCIGVILSGMGADGVEGAREIKTHGGTVICQDEESSVVWGMPSMAIKNELEDWVLPISEIGERILAIVS